MKNKEYRFSHLIFTAAVGLCSGCGIKGKPQPPVNLAVVADSKEVQNLTVEEAPEEKDKKTNKLLPASKKKKK